MYKLLLLCAVSIVFTQPRTLTDILAEAETKSAQLTMLRDQQTMIEQNRSLYRAGSNPELGLSTENFGASEIELTVSKAIRFKGDRLTADQKIAVVLAENSAQQIATKNEIHRELIGLFTELAGLQKQIALYDSLEKAIDKEQIDLNHRYRAGAVPDLDLQEPLRLKQQVKQQRLATNQAIRAVKTKYVTFGIAGIETVEPLESAMIAFTRDSLSFPENHPELIRIRSMKFESGLLRAEQTALKTPDFGITGGYKGSPKEKDHAIVLGVTLEIPTNRASTLAGNEADFVDRKATLAEESVRRSIESELAGADAEIAAVQERISFIKNESIPLMAQQIALMDRHVKAGRMSSLEKERARRDLMILQTDLISEESDLVRAKMVRAHLSGVCPLETKQ